MLRKTRTLGKMPTQKIYIRKIQDFRDARIIRDFLRFPDLFTVWYFIILYGILEVRGKNTPNSPTPEISKIKYFPVYLNSRYTAFAA